MIDATIFNELDPIPTYVCERCKTVSHSVEHSNLFAGCYYPAQRFDIWNKDKDLYFAVAITSQENCE